MQEIKLEMTKNPKEKPIDYKNLGFGKYYTDHMFIMNYDKGEGWHNPRITPYSPLSLDPAAMCLHYAQEVFEGLKAYKSSNGDIFLFRPEKNMARMNVSNERLCIPKIDESFCIEAIKKLVLVDREWIPSQEGYSLYIRPFIIGVDPHIGVEPAEHLMFIIILSPVGAYYANGLKPVKLCVESNYVRAVKGGMGFAKTGGNYASSLRAQADAEKQGYAQVLWLDGADRKYIEEVGSMNAFFVVDDEVITPELNGSILSGVTRMSVIELLQSWNIKVTERKISIDEIYNFSKEGKLKEAFGSGTAAVISPVGELKYGENIIKINNGEIGELSQKLYDAITAVQWGKTEDKFSWRVKIN